jgi:hypothetical protein
MGSKFSRRQRIQPANPITRAAMPCPHGQLYLNVRWNWKIPLNLPNADQTIQLALVETTGPTYNYHDDSPTPNRIIYALATPTPGEPQNITVLAYISTSDTDAIQGGQTEIPAHLPCTTDRFGLLFADPTLCEADAKLILA